MKSAWKTSLVLGAALAGAVGTGPAALAQSTIKAVVNGAPITSNEVRDRAGFLRLVHKTMGAAELTQAATDELVEDRLKLEEAKRIKIAVTDAEVDTAFAGMAKNMKATPEILTQVLRQQGVNPATLKARLKVQMVWQRMVMSRFSKTISISDSQVANALQKQADAGKDGAVDKNAVAQGKTTEYTLQQVTMVVPALPAGMGAIRMKEAEALRAKVTSCAGLVDIAKGFKETVVKSIGKRTADELPEQFRNGLAETAVGHLTKPNPGQRAVEMLAVCEKREIQGDFTVKAKVEGELREEEGKLLARRYMTELKRQAIITYK